MAKKYICTLPLLLLLWACSSQKPFDREKELLSYLTNIQRIEINQRQKIYVFVLNNSLCGTCVDETLVFIHSFFGESGDKKIILTGKQSTQLEKLFSDMRNTIVLSDREDKLAKYGLAYTVDYMFEIKGGKIAYWNYMVPNTLLKLEKRYQTIKSH